MSSFFNVVTLGDGLAQTLEQAADYQPKTQRVPLMESLGRLLGVDQYAPQNLPAFARSTLDGYGVKAASVFGASEFSPAFLKIIGKVEMGETASQPVGLEEAIYVPTGGMLPPGADAVVMIEYAEAFDAETIAVYQSVSPGTGVMAAGEDMVKGEKILTKGSLLTPGRLGALAAMGLDQVEVIVPPRIAYFSTGDEIIDPPTPLQGAQVWDITKYTVSGILGKLGITPTTVGHIPDQRDQLEATLKKAVVENDLVILSGGSSVGAKDLVAQVMRSMGEPGVFIHGLLMKPGKPAVVAKQGETLLFGLPGHPASAFLVMEELVLPVIRQMMGATAPDRPKPVGILTKNVPAGAGRRTYYTTQLAQTADGWQVTPLFGKSGAISWLAKADGYLVVPEGTEGLLEGEQVEINFFE